MSRSIIQPTKSMHANIIRSISTIIFVSLVFSSLICSAAIETDNGSNTATTNPADVTGGFSYQMENRADPFVPFITEKAAASKVNMDEIVDVSGPLTGMQLFEPGQLTLVAVMKTSSQDIAMVEDFTGKGYVLTEGLKIGRRGVIKDIVPNAVIIEETAETRAGKKIVTETVMTLRKEGEE